jgi:hypothetical protein
MRACSVVSAKQNNGSLIILEASKNDWFARVLGEKIAYVSSGRALVVLQ